MATASVRVPLHAWPALLPFGGAVVAVALVGARAASSSAAVYGSLDLPGFAPPSWVFGPVWVVLYVAIALAGWLAWRAGAGLLGVAVWLIQLALNLAWTPLFFAGGRYGWALVDIVALLVAIAVTIAVFARFSRPAAWLLVPYLAWVGFATALNAAIVLAN
ncbi:MAG: TspO/MBR family protein [Nocardioides sp.]|uniref:TspO/MBR family protein n=1 Tax=Nocardioides sp. TaxID=35761 RepID=UPI0039E5D784